ncbi:MAG: hypothetical protein BHW64_04805 [Candidatus Melainabacteria bacterium LEY3_CP_29_8]|nr:MAG: hypothetical protein BHW64_04805 [Candidatus Melainabacteria bacterium LEY3_CP_29_8]
MSFFRILLFAIIFISSHVSAFSQNYLSTIQIDSNDGGNQVTLKTVSGVEVIKEVKNNNLVVLELKNIKADEKLSTIYNNVLHVKNVVVKEPVKNNLQIVIEGDNIANTGVVVLPSDIKESISSKEKNIILDKPINEYAPIVRDNESFNSQNSTIVEYLSANFHVNTAKLLYLKRNLKNIFSGKNFDFIFYTAIFIFVIMIGNKFINKESEKDIKVVGLSSQSLKQSKTGFDITINDKTIPTLRGLKSSNSSSNNISRQYGISEYKKSDINPYNTSTNSNVIRKKQTTNNIPSSLSAQRKKQKPALSKDMNTLSLKEPGKMPAKASSSASLNNMTDLKRSNTGVIDSQKFLDSMTKIYEKSGRQDLAMNLKRVSRGKKA